MVDQTVPIRRDRLAESVAALVDSPEIAELVAELQGLRWTGRKGYPIRSMVGACLAKSLYAIPTWSRTARLIGEHPVLQAAIGCCPSVYALYRFTRKLRTHKPLLDACIDRVTAALREQLPGYGQDLATDASDLPAFANGQRYLRKNGPERERCSDPDASWGHRSSISHRSSGSYYGHKLHLAACARTDLPVAWHVTTARTNESSQVERLLSAVQVRNFKPETVAFDKDSDIEPVYQACHQIGALPVIPLREIPAVKQGKHLPPTCEHGTWTFAGTDFKHKRTKWRCPTGACQPKSVWRKVSRLYPLIPRETKRWGDLYRGRASVEREFGRLPTTPGGPFCHLSRPRASGRSHPDPSPAGASRPLDLRPQGDLAETGVLGVAI